LSVVPLSLEPKQLARLQILLGGVFLVTFVGFAFWARFDVPYKDDWDLLLFHLTGASGGAGLLAPHNEHVIPFARLMVGWQYEWGGVTGTLVQTVALACHFAALALFWLEIRRQWPDRPVLRGTVAGAVVVCLCATYQLQSVVFGAAVLFPLVQMWVVLALVATLHATGAGRDRRWWWVVVVAAAIGAAGSTTTGLVTPVLVAAVAWGRGAGWRTAAPFVALAAALGIGYVAWVGIGAGAPAVGAPAGLARTAAMVTYVAAVFGGGATGVNGALGVVVGAAMLTGMGAALLAAFRRPGAVSRVEWFALGVMAFAVVSAVAAAFGRAQFGVSQAGQSRYSTFVMQAVAALALFTASRVDRAGLSRRGRSLAAGLCVLASAALLAPQVYVGLLWKAKADTLAAAFLSIRSHAPDVTWLATLHPAPEVVLWVIDRVEAAGGRVVDPGLLTPVLSAATLPLCGGQWTLERHGRQGEMRLAGQSATSLTGGVIVDRAGALVGLSMPAPWVAVPNQPPSAIDRVVRDRVRGRVTREGDWLGFAQRGAGEPYRWVGRDEAGIVVCAQPLDVTPVINSAFDAIRFDATGAAVAIGWAFACGSPIAAWELRVDGAPVPVRVVSGLPRPDVETALRLECAPGAPPGVHLHADLAALAPGRHGATIRVVTASGHSSASNRRDFDR
jgi:hypothetical protein